jgi:5-methyltetrahydropteroyltriglutamate--homocysteine methyltransferase
MGILTNTVGSYPTHGIGEAVKAKMSVHDLMVGQDPFVASIEAAVEDQLRAGIDLISDGQVRADMVSAFAAGIPGMKSERGRSYITGKINRPLKSITAKDFILARQYAGEGAKIKGIITGPVTLAVSSSFGHGVPYRSSLDPRLLNDLAKALQFEAYQLSRAGAAALQIDEPVLYNVGVDRVLGFVDAAVEDIQIPVKLHPHVASFKDFEQLLKLKNVEYIGVEAAKYPSLLEKLTGAAFEDHGKKVALGVIDTDRQEVESAETVKKRIERGIDVFGDEMWINPDCGLRLQTREVAFRKLKVLVDAVTSVKRELNLL